MARENYLKNVWAFKYIHSHNYLGANVFLLIHTSFNKQQRQSKECVVQFHHCVSV